MRRACGWAGNWKVWAGGDEDRAILAPLLVGSSLASLLGLTTKFGAGLVEAVLKEGLGVSAGFTAATGLEEYCTVRLM